ncbi:prenyltransferase/squalene oxidase repeat-containing protein [Streptomyces sp. NPDC060031]|uniref:prenyltransferase/squalene oxidase repeat-containing protein n=1 Tax=Streptomyces sp. NPDC060031 TaxID=3347043 RepID=UPI0036985C5E
MNVRRSAAALAASAVLCAGAAPAALADTAAPSASAPPVIPSGLYGKNDPTYDGVFRQSLAFLAQHTAGVKPTAQAVDWLTGQQCANGSFPSFRPDTAKACDASTYIDSNATAAAVQALAALGGHDETVKKAVGWLKSVQNEDGGWSSSPGGAMDTGTDTNSTGIVIGALAAAGEKPDEVKSKAGTAPATAIEAFQITCREDGTTGDTPTGAFAFQRDKGVLLPNADATAAAVLGLLGKGMTVEAPKTDKPVEENPVNCKGGALSREYAAEGGSRYLTDTMAKSGDHLVSALAGAGEQPDFGNTADAVIALAAGGHKDAAAKPLAWLEQNAAAWAKTAGPGAYAQLILAAHAGGKDPKAFGGTDLVAELNAQGPAAQGADATAKAESKNDKDAKDDKDSGGQSVWWIIGAGAAAGMGIGILLSGRRKKNRL